MLKNIFLLAIIILQGITLNAQNSDNKPYIELLNPKKTSLDMLVSDTLTLDFVIHSDDKITHSASFYKINDENWQRIIFHDHLTRKIKYQLKLSKLTKPISKQGLQSGDQVLVKLSSLNIGAKKSKIIESDTISITIFDPISADIETELLKRISPQGGYGFYEGLFGDLKKKWGNKAVFPLLSIFENPNYHFRNKTVDQEKALQVRLLAGVALAEFGGVATESERLAVLSDLRRVKRRRPSQFWAEAVMEIADYCLYYYGDTTKFDLQVHQYKNQIRKGLKNKAETHFNLAMLYLRFRKIKLGIKELETAIKYAPRWSLAHYNLACGYACAGQREKAIAAITKAVKYGYMDVGWMVLDGDLRNIRNDPRFKKLIKKLQKDQKERKK